MTRYYNKNRRESTIVRDNHVLDVYHDVIEELGDLSYVVSKSYIYGKVKERTGLCTKTIAFIVNHVTEMGK